MKNYFQLNKVQIASNYLKIFSKYLAIYKLKNINTLEFSIQNSNKQELNNLYLHICHAYVCAHKHKHIICNNN